LDQRLSKPLVVITGASSGIGETFARRLASGHDLLLIARRKDRLEALAKELREHCDSKIEIAAADLTLEQDLAKVADRLRSDPELVLLINNAGFGTKGRFWESSLETQEEMHKLHVMATVRLTHAALGNLVARNWGGIINVASVAAFVRSPGSASYSATKTWMTAFTETLYLELKGIDSQVSVQALCPGFTYSEFHDRLGLERERLAPKAFWLTAEEVVDASLAGLRQKKLFVIPGWRYRWLAAVVSKLPTAVRLLVESRTTKARQRQLIGAERKAVNAPR